MSADLEQPQQEIQQLPGPLSSLEVRDTGPHSREGRQKTTPVGDLPLALREMAIAPGRMVPAHVYDPHQQVALDSIGRVLAPGMDKDWTTIEGTHTDGDGGDNELWDWEELR